MGPSDGEDSRAEASQSQPESFVSLPITQSFLKDNALDAELSGRSAIGYLGKPKLGRKTAANTDVDASSIANMPQGNWGVLEATLKARKEVMVAPTRTTIARDWQSMPSLQITPEMERDLRVIENRQHIDPKRFYKSSGTGRKKGELPTKVAFGTVIEAPHEFYSSRIAKRDRRKTFTEEIMSDRKIMDYAKSRVRKIQKHATRQRRVVDPAAKKERRERNRR